jgi:transposase
MYTDPIQWAAIRRCVLEEGQSIREVSRSKGLSRKTVRKMVRQETSGQFVRTERPASISAYQSLIDAMLVADESRIQRDRRSVAVIFRTLRDNHGYAGGYSAVRRYCRSVQVPQVDLDVRAAGGRNAIESLTIVGTARTYRLCALVPQESSKITLRLHRDRQAERKREVAEWIERLRSGHLLQPIPGDPEAIARLLSNVHMPQKRQRDRAITALAHEQGFPNNQIAVCLGLDRRTSRRYLRAYHQGGVQQLLAPETRGERKAEQEDLKDAVFRLLHEPPMDHGINRTSWIMRDLRKVLADQGFAACAQIVSQIIRDAGWKWKNAKTVLTSKDPAYREKLDVVQSILRRLASDEAFFSIDEFGPFSVKMKPGRMLDPPGRHRVVPQWQKSKGCMIMTAALELQSNQVTHFYSPRKNTTEMIRMLDLLLERYADRRTLFFSWDAASWHVSKKLFQRIDEHNASAEAARLPRVETAPLPAGAQFLNVIESVFSGMARAVIHNSDYGSLDETRIAIDTYFAERNVHFQRHPKRAGKRIWGKELVPPAFSVSNNCKDPRWR